MRFDPKWLAPPEKITPVEWVDRGNMIVSSRVSAVPGPVSLDLTPYLRGMLLLSIQPHVRVAWLMKCVQGAGSTWSRILLGYIMDIMPMPAMVLFPDEKSARSTLDEHIAPMFEQGPTLRQYVTGKKRDMSVGHIKLAHQDIYPAWAGSSQAVATRAIGVIIMDETDKYAGYRGTETTPINLILRRLTTYLGSKAFGLSTPTIPTGPIAKRFKMAGCRYHYHPVCKACREGMKPEWDQVKFEGKDSQDPDEIRQVRLEVGAGEIAPVYVCQHCDVEHSDAEYKQAVREGSWVPDGDERAEDIAFHLHGLVSPFPKMGVLGLAKSWLVAQLQGLEGLQDFYNQSLGLPFWDESIHGDAETQVGAATVWRKVQAGGEPGVVPQWAHTLVCGADSKKRGHYYTVRAFGPGWRSQLIAYGETSTSEELTAEVFRDWPKEKGGTMRVRLMCVDTGGGVGARDKSRSDELYRYTKTDPAHIKAIRGYGGGGAPGQPVVSRVHQYTPPGGKTMPYDITVSTIDTEYFKDLLASRINDEEDPDLWLACRGAGQDYVQQMASERKILVERRIKHGESRDIWRWLPRTAGAANHYWDSEVYALVAAYMLDVDKIGAAVDRARRPKRGGQMTWAQI